MAENKHTPGPWGISTEGCAPFTIDSADALICELLSGPTADMPTIEADARLIAAAPDLLEALEQIVDLGSDGEHSGDRHARCRQIARAAIARATQPGEV